MKKTIFYLMVAYVTTIFAYAQTQNNSQTFADRQQRVKKVIEKHIANGLPGVALAYYSGQEGLWTHSEGFSNIEEKHAMTNMNLQYLQSVTKTYMAVAILKLYEQGKLKLDDDISKYLNAHALGNLKDRGITIKMLLNHTSGIPDYATNPNFMAFVLKDLKRHFSVQQCIDFIKNDSLNFQPGKDYSYSNTNYVLLSMITDKITGNHVKFIEKEIFKPLDLKLTHYLTKQNYLSIPKITDSYWDVLNIEKPVNITSIQKVNVSSLRGDDGIVCAPADAVKFLKGLVEGKLLKPETMQLMQEWVAKDGAKKYGLGFSYYDLGVTYAIGHSGGGLGAGCVLMYLPELDAYVFMATNFTTLIESKIAEKVSSIQYEILSALFL